MKNSVISRDATNKKNSRNRNRSIEDALIVYLEGCLEMKDGKKRLRYIKREHPQLLKKIKNYDSAIDIFSVFADDFMGCVILWWMSNTILYYILKMINVKTNIVFLLCSVILLLLFFIGNRLFYYYMSKRQKLFARVAEIAKQMKM